MTAAQDLLMEAHRRGVLVLADGDDLHLKIQDFYSARGNCRVAMPPLRQQQQHYRRERAPRQLLPPLLAVGAIAVLLKD